MRIYELARDLGLESKEVLARAQELGIEVKTASSGLDEDSEALLRLSYEEEAAPPAAEEPGEIPAPIEASEPSEAPEPEATEAPEPEEEAEEPAAAPEPEDDDQPRRRTLTVTEGITIKEFADVSRRPVGLIVRTLIEWGEMAGAGQPVPVNQIERLADFLGYDVVVEEAEEEEVVVAPLVRPKRVFDDDPDRLRLRPPVVTVMGHVDHGKTKLLDTIRRANVVAGEAGGITQHIGAYQASVADRKITFIDTPGHEAFTTLRARGAELTDIVVLVVAADDGVMPQTVEAISHAKAAKVPIVVAINKTDLETADPYRVRAELTQHEIVVEELGGETVSVELSALTGEGVDQLLEYIDLIAELEGFSADPKAPCSGTVVEAQLETGRGPTATVIVQRGTLARGDALVAGTVSGRVRAMFDENGKQVKEAGPSTPVLIMGWDDVPSAGDYFEVVASDREARSIASDREDAQRREDLAVPSAAERLQMLLDDLRTSQDTELRIIVKVDAHGSLEAIRDAVAKIKREDGQVTIIHAAVGGITENDVLLADTTDAVVFGFNVRPDGKTRRAAEQAGVEIRTYRIIYELLDDIEAMLVGKLAPEEVEQVLGVAEVRATFRAPRFGTIAGCVVTEGSMNAGAAVRLVRDGVVVYDGKIGSLRRFKDDVESVVSGTECGIGLENYRDIKEGDVLESYLVREVART
jgi:translation initiation factor IF-2